MATNQEEIIKYDEFVERAQHDAEYETTPEGKKQSFRNSMRMSITEFVHQKKNRSIHVILSMSNSTIGSVALVLPASVLQGGLFLAIICMTIIGFINYMTCYFISVYQREDEIDLATIVRRILGPKWQKAFIMSSAFQLFVACIIYFLLINSICYPIIQFIMHKSGSDNYGGTDEITFSKFSIQYQALILFIPVFFLCSLKELNFIVKLGRVGVSSIFAYGIFLLYCFIENLADGNVSDNWDQMTFFSTDIVGVAGPFSFAFFVHTIVSQITATNINFKENPRNIGYGYLIVYLAYAYFSIVGSIGVVGRKSNFKDAKNINDFFTQDDVGPVVVDILYLIHLLTALPTLCHVSRTQFFILVQGETKPISRLQMYLYNGTFCSLGLLFQILCIDPSVIIEVNGAVCCFFIVYIIPFFFRYRESKRAANQESSASDNQHLVYEDSTNSRDHDEYLEAKRKAPIGIVEKIFWVSAMLIGLFLAIITLISIFGVSF